MIFTIERLDNNMQVSVLDDSALAPNGHLSRLWSLSEFIERFPSVPYESNIESVSFEPENNLFHVGYSDGTVQGYPTYKGHPTLEWVMNNYDAIYETALSEVQVLNEPTKPEPPIF